MSALMKFGLVIVVATGLLDFIWGSAAGFSFPPQDHYYWTTLLVTVFGAAALFYTYLRPDPKIAGPCWSLFTYALFMPSAIMLSYLVGSLNFPMAENTLVNMDAMLGFNWLAAIQTFTELPSWVSIASTKIYASSIWVMFLVACFLIFTGKHRRLDEYIVYFIVTCVFTSAIAGVMPATNAYEFFQPGNATYDKLSPIVGRGYYDDLFALRDGSLRQLKLVDVQGLVSFPSFHTIVSLILIYVMRGTGIFFAISLIWNVGIIATTPFDGAHYLVDIIGGVMVMLASVLLIRRLEPYLETLFSRRSQATQLVPQTQ